MSQTAPKSSLKSDSIQGFIWNVIGSGGQQLFMFLIFAFLARKLGAVDFGIMALASVFIDVLGMASRAGLTDVMVQRAKLDELEKATAFWTSLVLGAVFSLAMWAMAGPIADFYHQPTLQKIIEWLAVLPLLTALGTVHEGVLRRQFGFKTLALRTLIANCTGGVVALLMAMNDFGIVSLVMQRIISMALLTGIMWWNLKWWPRFEFSYKTSLQQLRIGGALVGANLLTLSNQRVIDLIVGYTLGPAALGYLRIAWRGFDMLMELGLRPISNVTLSTFSALQGNLPSLARAYTRLSQLTALISVPIFIGTGILAPEFITLLFGEQWTPSIVPMQLLTLSVVTLPLMYFKNNLLLAVGRARDVFWLNVVEFVIGVTVISVCAQFGLIGAAMGNVLRILLVTPPILYVLHLHVGVDNRQLLLRMVPVVHAATWMIVVLGAVRWLVGDALGHIGMMVISVPVGALVYGSVLWFAHRTSMLEMWDSLASERAKFGGKFEKLGKLIKR